MTGQNLRDKVVTAAKGWEGRRESDGSHREIIDLYNSHTPPARGYKMSYTDPWCSAFVSAAAIQAGLTDILPTECGCEEHIKRFQALGSWTEEDGYVPAPGDIVTACDGKTVTVIEGNLNHAVGYRTIPVNGRFIRGYGVPDYASLADKPQSTVPPVPAPPWYQPYADWAAARGIADGTRGDEPCTRGECWAMLKRLSEGR